MKKIIRIMMVCTLVLGLYAKPVNAQESEAVQIKVEMDDGTVVEKSLPIDESEGISLTILSNIFTKM